MPPRPFPALFAAALLAAPMAAQAQASDPAASVIDRLDQSLIDTMKDAKRLGPQGRYQRLEPVIVQTFDLPQMTRFAVGPSWTTLSPADQQALVRAFTRMTVANYAHNFDGYGGERFTIEPQVETRGPDKLVRTRLTSSGSAPTSLTYRMRQSGGGWKVIDVYYNGAVSSLTGQRSEFASTLRSGGAPALVRKLENRSKELMGGR
jgi:phospholipid transport system substrate-binding protein